MLVSELLGRGDRDGIVERIRDFCMTLDFSRSTGDDIRTPGMSSTHTIRKNGPVCSIVTWLQPLPICGSPITTTKVGICNYRGRDAIHRHRARAH